ncbi:hypothetical protein HBE96_16650 [Clostridium sp. P21]|uniref:Uncharacterized protein n=1 Tax=Clostridium muellerianum TaxID=2716538 RepID=A0A7Y0EJI0_9CLOT|nr:hypothetical protein [Clostridium muellerianum]NMM64257.1 hypothetical protein [Clostridium muellerianum]
MSREFYLKKVYAYAFEDIDVYFKYNNTVIYSTDKIKVMNDENGTFKARILELISTTCIEDHETEQDGIRHCIPEILKVQNVVSFFTGMPITVYNEIDSCFSMEEKYEYVKRGTTLVIEGKDYKNQLLKLIDKLQS